MTDIRYLSVFRSASSGCGVLVTNGGSTAIGWSLEDKSEALNNVGAGFGLAQTPDAAINDEVGHRRAEDGADEKVDYPRQRHMLLDYANSFQIADPIENKTQQQRDRRQLEHAVQRFPETIRPTVKRYYGHEDQVLHAMGHRIAQEGNVDIVRQIDR